MTYVPSAHYRAKNVFAVREWAIARMKADGEDVAETVLDIEDWCRVWIENDPLDNGGDASVRRGMRAEWRNVWAAYKRLSGR